MPQVAFDSLPGDARVWVFASDRALDVGAAQSLLSEVDAFLAQWNAHGHALRCARVWRDDRFLAIGVDQSTAGASGCSIDGLFRTLQRLQPVLGANLLPAGRVYWRDTAGNIRAEPRTVFAQLGTDGGVGADTPVFDTTVDTADAWRNRFERVARETWHATLVRA